MADPANPFNLGVANFRELGVNTSVIKRGYVFRTADLTFATDRDIEVIGSELGVKTYIDLRSNTSPHEVAVLKEAAIFQRLFRAAPQVPGQTRHVNISIADGLQNNSAFDNPSDPKHAFVRKFHKDVDENGAPRFRNDNVLHEAFLTEHNILLLKHNSKLMRDTMMVFADPANYPIAFGCAAGKDRTGLIGALVLAALGATREEIIDDFLVSNSPSVKETLAKNSERRRSHPLWTGGSAPIRGVASQADIPAVHLETVLASLDFVEKEHGGVVGYLASIGFGAEQLASLRATAGTGGRAAL